MGVTSWNDVRVGRSEARHQAINRFERTVAELARQVSIDSGGARVFVAEILLDQLKGDAGFQEMGGVSSVRLRIREHAISRVSPMTYEAVFSETT
jgi:hypothetical protein